MKTTTNKKVLLVAAVMTAVTGSVFAANIDNSTRGNAGNYNAENSLFVGRDHTINVAEAGFNPAQNVAMLGDTNHMDPHVKSSLVTGHGNNIMASYSVTGGMHNTIHKEATYSLTAGWQNSNMGNSSLVVGHTNAVREASNTLAFGFNNKIENGSDNSFVGGESSTVNGKNSFAFGNNAEATTDNTYAIGAGATAGAENAVAIGNGAKATTENSVALGDKSVTDTAVSTDSTTIAGTAYNFAGGTAVGTLSIGDNGAERTITNVAAGRVSETSTDAVNGSQLHATIKVVEKNHSDIVDNAAAITRLSGRVSENTKGITTNTADIRVNTNYILDHEGRITVLERDGNTIKTDLANTQKQVDSNTKAIQENRDFITINSDKLLRHEDRLNGHDVAIANLDNKIDNGLARANHYTDTQVAKVGANAAALAALHPLDYDSNHKTDIMAGAGHYKGKTAAALGVAYRPNENVMFTFGATINGKDTMVNGGVSYKVGAKGSTYTSQLQMATQIKDLQAIVDKLLEDNQELHKALEAK